MRKLTVTLLALALLGVGVSAQSAPRTVGRNVLILGTSTTEGMGATPAENRYTAVVARARPLDSFTVVGRGGTTLADPATPNWLDYAVPSGYDVVVLQFGFNEWNRSVSPEIFHTWAGDFVARVRTANPGARLVWLSPWISQYTPTLPDARAELWQRYGQVIAAVLRAAGGEVTHVDLDPTGSRRLAAPYSLGSPDGLHYGNRGHAAIADALLRVL